jgi:hypothetical protein
VVLSTRTADAAFAELICADPQWLREEFDALIASSFGQPPAAPPPAPPRMPPPRRFASFPGPPWLRTSFAAATFPAGPRGRCRQRSPPVAAPPQAMRLLGQAVM